MYCPKCKRQVSGDICPDCGYKSAFKKMDDLVGAVPESPAAVPVAPGTAMPMKEKPATSGFKPMDLLGGEAKKATVNQDMPASGGFKSMGVLPGGKPEKTTGTTPANAGDVPASGGFKRMDPLNIPNGHNTTGGTKVPATGAGNTTDPNSKKNRKPENDRKSFSWKRWVPALTGVAIVSLIIVLCFCLNKAELTNAEAEELIYNEVKLVMNYDTNTSNPLVDTLMDGLKIDVHSIQKENRDFLVDCTFTNYDVADAFASMNQILGELTLNEYINYLTQAIKSADRMETHVTVSLVYVQEIDAHMVKLTNDHLDAAMGGFLSYATQQ